MAKRSGFSVKIVERGDGLERLYKLFAQDFYIKLGIFGDKASQPHQDGDGSTVVEIASKNEFGIGVPERSVLRAFIDENKDLIRKDLRNLLQKAVTQNFPIERGLRLLGAKYVGMIKQKISAGVPPQNSRVTIARKGSSKPWIDTGQTRSAFDYDVEKGLPK